MKGPASPRLARSAGGDPPRLTLVTYSTLMMRAVSLGRPRVALRLWSLLRSQPDFYASPPRRRAPGGTPSYPT